MNKLLMSVLIPIALYCSSANAINVGAITSIMPPEKDVIPKEVINNVNDARFVSLKIERISSPLEGGEVIAMENKKEIMATPANLILPGNGKDVFRIFYTGPKDDKERYYHMVWQDNPVAEDGSTKSKKSASATTSATISTILVVAPRKEKFAHEYRNGVVYNKGNSTFRVVAMGPCKTPQTKEEASQGCRERYYVMPSMGVKLKFVDTHNPKSSVGIWHHKDFINVK
ncbi:hypothetical protein F3J28_12885 [Enterobacter sp. Ap-1006]|uniref:EcpB family pilus assembly chaperone n=1 Tax=Enterobacter sp. Ap-1006 TaxID=2608345 RepID=UPI00141FA94D|nr:hypothetical protein [Enterobacter sp. Ap-1006]NIF48659.1 hypothetical protein [Enterobacter sp. Ap-1006]